MRAAIRTVLCHPIGPLLGALGTLALSATNAWATTAEEIMEKARAARSAENAIQTVEMAIIAKTGSERIRELELKMKVDGEVRKSLARFTSPSDVAGTQLLLIDNPGQTDEQLLYLPAVKRTNRISGSSRKGSFMGSDFAYEDMELSDPPGATHTVTAETDTTWTIETKPGPDSSYTRLVTTVRKADFVPERVQFYDADGALLKELVVDKTELDGALTIVTSSTMKNVQKGTATRLTVKAHQLNVPADQLPDDLFTKAAMEQGG